MLVPSNEFEEGPTFLVWKVAKYFRVAFLIDFQRYVILAVTNMLSSPVRNLQVYSWTNPKFQELKVAQVLVAETRSTDCYHDPTRFKDENWVISGKESTS